MALWLGEATGAGRLVAVTAAQTVSVTHAAAAAAAAAAGLRSHPGSAASILHTCVESHVLCLLTQLPSESCVNSLSLNISEGKNMECEDFSVCV